MSESEQPMAVPTILGVTEERKNEILESMPDFTIMDFNGCLNAVLDLPDITEEERIVIAFYIGAQAGRKLRDIEIISFMVERDFEDMVEVLQMQSGVQL